MQILLVGVDRDNSPIEADRADHLLFADDQREAANILSHIETDVIVLDCSRSPDKKLEEEIRSLKKKAVQPIVVLVRDGESGSKALEAGAQDFLIYSLINEDLFSRVIRYACQLHATTRSLADLTGEIERLKGNDNPFSSFFVQSPVGMVVMDLDGRLLRSNSALHAMLGCSAEELKGKRLSSFLHPDASREYAENLAALQADKLKFFETESRFHRNDGQLAWWRLTLSLLRFRSDRPRFIFGLVKDISRWKRSEVDLQRAKELAEQIPGVKQVEYTVDTVQ